MLQTTWASSRSKTYKFRDLISCPNKTSMMPDKPWLSERTHFQFTRYLTKPQRRNYSSKLACHLTSWNKTWISLARLKCSNTNSSYRKLIKRTNWWERPLMRSRKTSLIHLWPSMGTGSLRTPQSSSLLYWQWRRIRRCRTSYALRRAESHSLSKLIRKESSRILTSSLQRSWRKYCLSYSVTVTNVVKKIAIVIQTLCLITMQGRCSLTGRSKI